MEVLASSLGRWAKRRVDGLCRLIIADRQADCWAIGGLIVGQMDRLLAVNSGPIRRHAKIDDLVGD